MMKLREITSSAEGSQGWILRRWWIEVCGTRHRFGGCREWEVVF